MLSNTGRHGDRACLLFTLLAVVLHLLCHSSHLYSYGSVRALEFAAFISRSTLALSPEVSLTINPTDITERVWRIHLLFLRKHIVEDVVRLFVQSPFIECLLMCQILYVPYCQYLCAFCWKPPRSGRYQVSASSNVSPLGNYRKDTIHCQVNSAIYIHFHPQDATGSFSLFHSESMLR